MHVSDDSDEDSNVTTQWPVTSEDADEDESAPSSIVSSDVSYIDTVL
jgi:hypothetical protein